jgi:hypothetical protein
MDSNQSLVGLINQLQKMEDSMSSLILEFASKMAALTDVSIFVLIENQEGRKFAGKRHLTESYLSGNMKVIGNDLELEFEKTSMAKVGG